MYWYRAFCYISGLCFLPTFYTIYTAFLYYETEEMLVQASQPRQVLHFC